MYVVGTIVKTRELAVCPAPLGVVIMSEFSMSYASLVNIYLPSCCTAVVASDSVCTSKLEERILVSTRRNAERNPI